jgi:uncharacterized protein YjbI with pentapeptide repeats
LFRACHERLAIMPKKPAARLICPPDAPDDHALTSFPDDQFTNDAWYQNLVLHDADRSEQKARDSVLEQAVLERVNLVNTRLDRARLNDVLFDRCDLTGWHLGQARLERVVFRHCRLLGFGASEASL